MACAGFDPAGPLVGTVQAFADCQARALGQQGWAALSPAGPWGPGLTAAMVLAVAVFGWRLMLGGGLRLADAVGLAGRLGLVLALAGQWPAWQALAYDTVNDGGAALSAALMPGAGDLAARVDGVSAALSALRQPAGEGAPAPAPEDQHSLLWAGRLVALAGLGWVLIGRLGGAVVLALGPMAAGLLLFSATRGVFYGWARAAAACVVAQVALSAVLAVELAMLEPQITALAGQYAAGQAGGVLVEQVWLVAAAAMMVGAVVLLGVGLAVAAPGRWVRLRPPVPEPAPWPAPPQAAPALPLPAGHGPAPATLVAAEGRARQLALSLIENDQRHLRLAALRPAGAPAAPRAAPALPLPEAPLPAPRVLPLARQRDLMR